MAFHTARPLSIQRVRDLRRVGVREGLDFDGRFEPPVCIASGAMQLNTLVQQDLLEHMPVEMLSCKSFIINSLMATVKSIYKALCRARNVSAA
jgi:hypothetical protein